MNSLIKVLVPSCDRASQLFTLLESTEKNCPNTFEWYILYKCNNKEYQIGYDKLIRAIILKDYPVSIDRIHFAQEENCCEEFYRFFEFVGDDPYFSLFVDDCIFFRELNASPKELTSLLDCDEENWCVTLRMSKNTYVHSYTHNILIPPLPIDKTYLDDKYIRWDSYKCDRGLNSGMVHGWDGCVYPTQLYLKMLNNVQFTDLRHVEHTLNNDENKFSTKKPYMVAPALSCVFSAQYNCVHKQRGYYGSVVRCEQKEFNDNFLNNEVIDWENMNLKDIIKSCHFEPPIKWRKL